MIRRAGRASNSRRSSNAFVLAPLSFKGHPRLTGSPLRRTAGALEQLGNFQQGPDKMALDHYVPQTYLRHWANAKGQLHAIRKSDLKKFSPGTRNVCAISDGNTNPFLQPARAIEEFLEAIEPKYDWAIDRFVRGEMHREAIYVIAGLISSIMVCSPGGARLNAKPVARILEEMTRRLDRGGQLPVPPESMGGASFTQLLEEGKIRLNVNPKHPQAIGILAILEQIAAYGNFRWEFLVNLHEDSPFFTSDYPVAIERQPDMMINRVFPLTPSLAVRIHPDREVNLEDPEFLFRHFRFKVTKLPRSRVRYINTLLVRCAEETVFFRDDAPWIPAFVEKNAGFRIEPVVHQIQDGNATLMINTFLVTDDWDGSDANLNDHGRQDARSNTR